MLIKRLRSVLGLVGKDQSFVGKAETETETETEAKAEASSENFETPDMEEVLRENQTADEL